MKIAVLGSTGQTGRLVIARALERGHDVIALARRPERVDAPAADNLWVVRADVTHPGSVTAAVEGADVVVSTLGIVKGQDPAILVQGAQQIASATPRVVFLTSLGMGATEGALGAFNGALLKRILRHEWDAKRDAGRAVRAAGGTTVHAGPLTNKPHQGDGRLMRAADFGPRLIPPMAPRAGIAALLVAEAEEPRFTDSDTIALFESR
ncbi:NAD(P)-dependent oxidoreductase [Streptomyces antarcticus]|uniref:NAD(P)-dependent oxidoreductase n=1 Tax=Streptomyces antarcticus TaxID=2996458 RepID=UPI00226D84DE|nr:MULTISPECIES: NAD(P)-binding oxidoreductase [unclassified Streptomyces]MCY0944162.1 SDR family oxidoreductase [Streptomyces sp. H34-AA3]MCZ4086883.1 SDR family oxidoreductase [Streptomyces sp. H34-S5]